MVKLQSAREDKRGHWPRGKRRNDPGPHWPAIKRKLARVLATPERKPGPSGLTRSKRGLADYLAVSDRQVRNWANGDDLPTAERVDQIREWLAAIAGGGK